LRLHNLDQARADLETSWQIKPTVSTGLLLNWLALLAGQTDEQMLAEQLEIVADLAPRHNEAAICRSIALYLRQQYEQALAALAQAQDVGPENEYAFFWQGVILLSQKRQTEAAVALQRAHALRLPALLWQTLARLSQADGALHELCASYISAQAESALAPGGTQTQSCPIPKQGLCC
jgi:lipoprotein NlpI